MSELAFRGGKAEWGASQSVFDLLARFGGGVSDETIQGEYSGDVSPRAAWDALSTDPDAVLVDVRTAAEWSYVGVPDLSTLKKQPLFVEWQRYPEMNVNERFAAEIRATGVDVDAKLYFLCRSGVRSKAAAITVTADGYRHCYNVQGGFEGNLDGDRHRGRTDGWKVDGLPWVQQ